MENKLFKVTYKGVVISERTDCASVVVKVTEKRDASQDVDFKKIDDLPMLIPVHRGVRIRQGSPFLLTIEHRADGFLINANINGYGFTVNQL